jgi:hypothetical protein
VYLLGGIFLIGADGRVQDAHYPRHVGDRPASGAIAGIVGR